MDIASYLLGKRAGGGGGKGSLKIQVVEELPETGEANVLYLVPRQVAKTRNVFDEYLYVNEAWELVGTTDIDISGKQDKMQFATMPSASSSNVGQIVQYIGTTNANYTNGYFYICLSDGGDPATYSWKNLEVQSNIYYINFNVQDTETNLKSILKPIKYIADNNLNYLILGIKGMNSGICYIIKQSETRYDLRGLTGANHYGFAKYGRKYYACAAFELEIRYVGSEISKITQKITNTAVVDDPNYNLSSAPLAAGNTEAFTPTGNYNPATKKYVDDSIASAITDALGGDY